jgi:hypothetical protein
MHLSIYDKWYIYIYKFHKKEIDITHLCYLWEIWTIKSLFNCYFYTKLLNIYMYVCISVCIPMHLYKVYFIYKN